MYSPSDEYLSRPDRSSSNLNDKEREDFTGQMVLFTVWCVHTVLSDSTGWLGVV